MPVAVTCSCGKKVRIPEDHPGKRINCPECGEGVRVPARSTTVAEPPPDAMIRFTCECGKQLQAKATFAGKLTRCPECGSKQEIPDASEEDPREARNRIQS